MTFLLKSFWAHFQSKLQLSIFFLSQFSGPNLPYGLSGAAMVTFPNASRLIHLGGYCGEKHEYCDKIWELVTSNPMKWVALDQKLESARYGHVAYLIPDELTCCKLILQSRSPFSPVKIVYVCAEGFIESPLDHFL